MTRRYNTGRGGKKAKGYGGSGMKKHGKSGTPHNHAVSIARAREEAQRIAEEQALKNRRKTKNYASVRELFEENS